MTIPSRTEDNTLPPQNDCAKDHYASPIGTVDGKAMIARRKPWGIILTITGFLIGAPFAFGAIKVPVPDAAKLGGGGMAMPAGAVPAMPAGAVQAATASVSKTAPCGAAPGGSPAAVTRAQPAGSLQ